MADTYTANKTQKILNLTCTQVTAEIKKALNAGDQRRAFCLYTVWGKFEDYASRASKVRHTKLYKAGLHMRGNEIVYAGK
jgi:hypothetical protein